MLASSAVGSGFRVGSPADTLRPGPALRLSKGSARPDSGKRKFHPNQGLELLETPATLPLPDPRL